MTNSVHMASQQHKLHLTAREKVSQVKGINFSEYCLILLWLSFQIHLQVGCKTTTVWLNKLCLCRTKQFCTKQGMEKNVTAQDTRHLYYRWRVWPQP